MMSAPCRKFLAARQARANAEAARLDAMSEAVAHAPRAAHTAGMVRVHRSIGLAAPRRRVPKQVLPLAIERAYGKDIAALVDRADVLVIRPMLADLWPLLAQVTHERGAHRDSADAVDRMDGIGDRLRSMADAARAKVAAVVAPAVDIARKHVTATVAHAKTQLGRQAKAALGISPHLSDAPLRVAIEAHIAAGVEYITKTVQKAVDDAIAEATRALQLALSKTQVEEEIARRVEIARGHAGIVGADQTQKVFGLSNVTMQEGLGVTKFLWISQRDSRVRPSHKEYDQDQEWEFDDPPGGELPGVPFGCRCWPSPVWEDIRALIEADQDPGDESD